MTRVPALLLTLSLLLPLRRAEAQDTPEAAALAYAASIRAADWAGAARQMHPSALRQMRDFFTFLTAADDAAELRQTIFGVASTAEAAALPDTVAFSRFLKFSVSKQGPDVMEMLSTSTTVPLGHVSLGADSAFVVLLVSFQSNGLTIRTYDVHPMQRDGGTWRSLLTADMSNLVAMLQRIAGAGGS